ncbi:hypothetical protein P8452_51229 [Trifolium repens]|nr:hypothetical protein P8452_51229 [Trifolium repens]
MGLLFGLHQLPLKTWGVIQRIWFLKPKQVLCLAGQGSAVEFLKLWNSKTWDVACSLSLDHVLNVKGISKKDAKAFSVANVETVMKIGEDKMNHFQP